MPVPVSCMASAEKLLLAVFVFTINLWVLMQLLMQFNQSFCMNTQEIPRVEATYAAFGLGWLVGVKDQVPVFMLGTYFSLSGCMHAAFAVG